MFRHPWVIGITYSLLAILCALCVILPVFVLVDWLYDDGNGLTRLLIAVPVAWFALARMLRRRRITL